jgi:hypothetical protein
MEGRNGLPIKAIVERRDHHLSPLNGLITSWV